MFHVSRAFAWLEASRDFRFPSLAESLPELSLTRRRLLTGAAATTVGLLVPAGSAGKLRISSSRDQICVELEERAWVIDRATFGPAARLRYREDAGAHFISVERSHLTELSRRADFDASLRVVAGQWRLELRIFETTFDAPFLAWLEGKHAAMVPDSWYFAGRRVGSQGAYLECLPRSAAMEISPQWQVRLRAEAPIASLCMDGLVLQSRDVQLTLGAHRSSSTLDLVRRGGSGRRDV